MRIRRNAAVLVGLALGVAACAADDPAMPPVQPAASQEERFGLTVAQRQQVFRQAVAAEERARRRAQFGAQRNPDIWGSRSPAPGPELLQAHTRIAQQWGLSLDQLEAVVDEGYASDWPRHRER